MTTKKQALTKHQMLPATAVILPAMKVKILGKDTLLIFQVLKNQATGVIPVITNRNVPHVINNNAIFR